MAADEMREICLDKWSDDLWGATNTSPASQAETLITSAAGASAATTTTTDTGRSSSVSPNITTAGGCAGNSAALLPHSRAVGVGGIQEPAAAPKLYFYWGRADHWVADVTREAVIAARGGNNIHGKEDGVEQQDGGTEQQRDEEVSESTRPVMEIATDDVPHAFCLRQEYSEAIARKCWGYVKDLLRKRGL